ncbi:MAG: hypothetical protein A2W05_00380 [Candidatus Schekmanbacteria bacterium RBG_16_38_10]|uniref:DUF1565 domain-containing protein n=1 Tax=Candidatus Schekmanbacteria bacterium RBG_16_38_10 TaxID=1817879 RepID=A0A1F7RR14_9BACT|nr:MAG: hypothetical protein A2W05_00380 [Candidatus Schekmanbacteria bacterium RBG_16_38_10]
MKNKIYILNVALMLLTFAFASPLRATDYYVDQNHKSANDQNTGTIDQPWKTIAKANVTSVAGDTVFIKAGTYNTFIAPSNSGTSANRITYRNYGTDIVTIQGAAYGIRLNGTSYITVQGINFYNLDRFMYLENGANHNIIAYSSFDQMRTQVDWAGSKIVGSSSYNWVHHSRFSNYGACTGTPPNGNDVGAVLEIGDEESMTAPNNTPDHSDYNLIENNTMYNGGHHVLGVMGKFNVIRNNHLHNAAWSNGRGNRTLYMNGYATDSSWNLIEGNKFGYAAAPCDATLVSGTQITSGHNIFRRNSFYYNNRAGLQFSVGSNYYQDIVYNHVYNNTFFHNALGNSYERDPGNVAVYFAKWSGSLIVKYNTFKNNLYYGHPAVYGTYGGPTLADQTFASEYNGDVSGDPKFINATATLGDPLDSNYPNLDLQSISPYVNVGTYLTTITSSSGSGTSFVVADAGYFMDGWGITGVQGDEIRLFGSSQKARITSINYSSNLITVDRTLTWTQNQGISLAYEGVSPDAGAYEFIEDLSPSAPTNLRIN